jgi:hypothetical protein
MPNSRPPIRRIEACARRRWTSLSSALMEALLEVQRWPSRFGPGRHLT